MRFWLQVLIALLVSFASNAEQQSDKFAPESGHARRVAVNHPTNHLSSTAQDFIVVTAHPLASKAGNDILANGGNAIDAMVAVQAVLGLVEPQSSGLGGGAFLLYYDSETKNLTSFDGRETAPHAVDETLFIKPDQTPMDFFDAVVGGRSVGTPGTVKLLWETHKKKGSMAWNTLLQPAIDLARKGFTVSPRLAGAVANDVHRLSTDTVSKHYFIPNGKPIQSGDILKNPIYADTLEVLSKQGGNYFYQPEFSREIVQKVQDSANAGFITQKDFDAYRITERTPVCAPYREFDVCGMGPPSSGAITLGQILGILESFSLNNRLPESVEAWHLISEASRLAFADRGLYIADTDFIDMPKGLLSKSYLEQRASLINPNKAADSFTAGAPDPFERVHYSPGVDLSMPSTTHFVIVDRAKNIVSMTSTIENGFGSRLMVKGFLLNNELTDFSFSPSKNEISVANRVEPGKRPRSSMAPTIVFKNKQPYLALGSPGGSRIINYVANTLIRILDWQQPIQVAFNQPHIINRFGPLDIEAKTDAVSMKQGFEVFGYNVSIKDLNSGLHGVQFNGKTMIGAADPRREGLVLGQ